MGFDWEYLLDADGEDLQAAYDDLCDDPWESDGCWEEDPPVWSAPSSPVPEHLRGTCAAGEIVLATSELFRSYRLRLYHELSINGWFVHYLVAKDNAPLLAIILNDATEARYSEHERCGVPLLRLPRRRMEQGAPQEVLSRLASMLAAQREEPAPFQPRIGLIPVSLHARMAGLRMIRQQNGHLWTPTAYGHSLGVIDGYLPPDEEGRYYHTLFIPAQYKARLDEALAFGRKHDAPFRPKLSWAQTMLRARQGLPRSDAYAAGIAHAFASMHLAEYMNPEELETLHRELSLDGETTYQEAADLVFQLCMKSDRTLAYDNRCMNLILTLTKPVLSALSAMPRPAT